MNNRVHQGHLARKRFGQNFLNDQFVIESIVSAINPQKGQAMVEIGPGLAALTEPVGERLDKLTVIELDRDLAARLQTHPFLGPKLTIYQQDAMTMNFGELAQTMGQPLRVFGNLPYNISTPLMFHLFSYTFYFSAFAFLPAGLAFFSMRFLFSTYQTEPDRHTDEYVPQIRPTISGRANSRMEDTPRM